MSRRVIVLGESRTCLGYWRYYANTITVNEVITTKGPWLWYHPYQQDNEGAVRRLLTWIELTPTTELEISAFIHFLLTHCPTTLRNEAESEAGNRMHCFDTCIFFRSAKNAGSSFLIRLNSFLKQNWRIREGS